MTWTQRKRRSALPACLTLLPAVLLTACSGGSTHAAALARADARPLAVLATRISHEGPCAQRRDIRVLQQRAIDLVNAGRVPNELQDPLMSGVNALAKDTPPCVPAVPVAPAPPSPPAHGHGDGHGHGKHGHGKHGGD